MQDQPIHLHVVQRCYSVTVLRCYGVTVLKCFSVTVLQLLQRYSDTEIQYSDVLGGAHLKSSMGEQGECYTVTVLQKCEYSDVLGGELYNAPHKQRGRGG